jgi:hypothetical protein
MMTYWVILVHMVKSEGKWRKKDKLAKARILVLDREGRSGAQVIKIRDPDDGSALLVECIHKIEKVVAWGWEHERFGCHVE